MWGMGWASRCHGLGIGCFPADDSLDWDGLMDGFFPAGRFMVN